MLDPEFVVSGVHETGPLVPSLIGKQYKKVKFRYFTLTTSAPNNCVILKDSSVFMIKNFVKDRSGQIFMIGSKYVRYDDLFVFPAHLELLEKLL